MATTTFPTRDDFAALLNQSLGGENEAFEGKVVKGTVTGIENDMSTPLGVFELKYFFSRAMTSTSGNSYSGTAIRGLIKDMRCCAPSDISPACRC